MLRSTEVHPEFCGLSSLIILTMLVLLGVLISDFVTLSMVLIAMSNFILTSVWSQLWF